MAYCGTQLVSYLSQIEYDDLTGFADQGALNTFTEDHLIFQAERTIDNFVGRREGTLRHFNAHGSVSWLLDGSGKTAIFFPPRYSPPIYIGNVNIDGASTGASSPTQIKLHEQYVDYDNSRFRKGHLNIEFFGTYGYAAVPADVALICGQLASNFLLDARRRRWAASGLTSLGAISINVSAAIFGDPNVFTEDMKTRLKSYRIKWLDVG